MLTPIPQFTEPSYVNRTSNEVQRCVNLYPEKTEGGWRLISTPGFASGGNSAPNGQTIRGVISTSVTGDFFSVHGNRLYQSGVFDRGTLTGSSGLVYMAENGIQILIIEASTGSGYTYNILTTAFAAITDVNFPDAISCSYQDGYFIVAKRNSAEFYLSKLLDAGNWTPVAFATAESQGDYLTGVYSNGQSLYLIGNTSIEIWYNTGAASFPFQRINGSTLSIGCVTLPTVANWLGDLFLLGSGKVSGSVLQISGTSFKKISTPYIESFISGKANQNGCWGMAYIIDGHVFYELTIGSVYSGTPFTFVYDINEATWHQKESNVTGSYINDKLRFIVGVDTLNPNSPYCFDATTANIYILNGINSGILANANTENGTAIRRQRIFGPIESKTKKLFHYQIRIEAEVKFDATGTTSISASLSWSDNAGLTYTTPITMTATTISSAAGQRVVWVANRLGASACRYYQFTLTGPAAKIILKNCEIDLKEGRF